MKASELVALLQKVIAEHGDLTVVVNVDGRDRDYGVELWSSEAGVAATEVVIGVGD